MNNQNSVPQNQAPFLPPSAGPWGLTNTQQHRSCEEGKGFRTSLRPAGLASSWAQQDSSPFCILRLKMAKFLQLCSAPVFKRVQTNFNYNSADFPGVISWYAFPGVVSQFDPQSFSAPRLTVSFQLSCCSLQLQLTSNSVLSLNQPTLNQAVALKRDCSYSFHAPTLLPCSFWKKKKRKKRKPNS